jgi:hypothetical protein
MVAPTAAPTIRPTFGLSKFEFGLVDGVCEAGKLRVGDESNCVVCPGEAVVPLDEFCEEGPELTLVHCRCDEAVTESASGLFLSKFV